MTKIPTTNYSDLLIAYQQLQDKYIEALNDLADYRDLHSSDEMVDLSVSDTEWKDRYFQVIHSESWLLGVMLIGTLKRFKVLESLARQSLIRKIVKRFLI